MKRDCTRAASAGSTWKWAGYGTRQEDSNFGLFAVFSAGFCTLEPIKVQLKSIPPGAVIAGGVICAIGYNS